MFRWFNPAMRIPATSSKLCKIGLMLMLSAPMCANAAQLQDLKLLAMDGQTQVELSLSEKSSYKVFTLSNPERLVLDLPATSAADSFKLPGANGVISNVRTGQPTPGTLRIVFDLSKSIQTKSHLEGNSNTRLVLELIDPNAKTFQAVAVNTNSDSIKISESKVADIKAAMQDVLTSEQRLESNTDVTELKRNQAAGVKSDNKPSSRFPATKTLQSVFGNSQRDLIIAIDAGHGGKDPGASGPSGVKEKNITLATARELAKQINAQPGMKAFLVRDDDTFVVLQDRYMRARKAQADLFVSIHADAALNGQANGSSVFVLSLKGASSQAARWLADKENAADLVGGVSLDAKDKNLAAVLLDLSQSATMRVSDDIAEQVLGSIKEIGRAHKPHVEHANFVVLRSPDVPSMLIETGFITNPGEEKKLSDPAHRERLASAVVSGIRGYFTQQAPPGTWFAAQQERNDDSSGSRQYVVSRGETLRQIATRHGVPMGTILLANNKRNDDVRVGEHLIIPSVTAPK
jgi:N-acetylmuramoyl-L-alanine amidase